MNLNERIEAWLDASTASFPASNSRPFVTLCYAQGWDGSIATRRGAPLSLSGEQAGRLTHQLRSLHDGILVGIDTVLADDPRLTVRHWDGANPQPIVLDSQGRLPPTARLRCGERPCWVLTTAAEIPETSGAQFLRVAADSEGRVALRAALALVRERGIERLMVEGGANVITAFLREGLADALVLTIAPTLVGGYKAVGDLGCDKVDLPRIAPLNTERLGDDLIAWGLLQYGRAADA